MNEKNYPLPVKKNKFNLSVAKVSATEYYWQVMEEVLEAQKASILREVEKIMAGDGCGQCIETAMYSLSDESEAHELVDIITCAVTRLYVLGFTLDEKVESLKRYEPFSADITRDVFYRSIVRTVLNAHQSAVNRKKDEVYFLFDVISDCIGYLELLGYDLEKRQILYNAVNEKNCKRGYFEGAD